MATRPRLARPFDTPPRTRAAPGRIERFPQTVHGGTHFAAERWIPPIVHGSTVHGRMSWFSMRKLSWGLSHHDSGTAGEGLPGSDGHATGPVMTNVCLKVKPSAGQPTSGASS